MLYISYRSKSLNFRGCRLNSCLSLARWRFSFFSCCQSSVGTVLAVVIAKSRGSWSQLIHVMALVVLISWTC